VHVKYHLVQQSGWRCMAVMVTGDANGLCDLDHSTFIESADTLWIGITLLGRLLA
jgi:hypothetical protein